MKQTITILTLILISLPLLSQKIFVRGGSNFSKMDFHRDNNSVFINGFQIGGGFNIPNYSLSPEFNVFRKGYKEPFSFDFSDEVHTLKVEIWYVSSSLLFYYTFNPNSDKIICSIKTGPYFSYAFAGNIEDDISVNYGFVIDYAPINNAFPPYDFGMHTKICLEYSRCLLEIGYQHGIEKEKQNRTTYLNLGYRFGNPKSGKD